MRSGRSASLDEPRGSRRWRWPAACNSAAGRPPALRDAPRFLDRASPGGLQFPQATRRASGLARAGRRRFPACHLQQRGRSAGPTSFTCPAAIDLREPVPLRRHAARLYSVAGRFCRRHAHECNGRSSTHVWPFIPGRRLRRTCNVAGTGSARATNTEIEANQH